MVNHALFDFPRHLKNIPDKLSEAQLKFSDSTKQVLAQEIRTSVNANIDYGQIYQFCKERAIKIADALGVTPIPVLLESANLDLLTITD